ncbi:histidine phosphatase family protein [Sutcliffiella sp. NPDC057660]|uniref:histidine phosphatase family protein n=1 Tax=Sutcliffiella sp. NPDC057660 TaxID=3346199 RepID=UPI00368CA026
MGTCGNVDLFLVRHGITDWNRDKRYLGHTDRGVLIHELFRLHALRKELMNHSFDYVFTSDLLRCRETVSYLGYGAMACTDRRLRELNFGEWEGKTYEELKDNDHYRKWLTDWENESPPNGESGRGFTARVDDFIHERFLHITEKPSARILLVTHGGVIRFLLARFKATDTFWEGAIQHGQGVRISLTRKEGEWTCNSLSEVPLPGKGI